jgi:hypothetical protein
MRSRSFGAFCLAAKRPGHHRDFSLTAIARGNGSLFGTLSVPMPRTCSGVDPAGFYADVAFLRRCPGLVPGSFTLLWIPPERERPRNKSGASREKKNSLGRNDREAPRSKSGASCAEPWVETPDAHCRRCGSGMVRTRISQFLNHAADSPDGRSSQAALMVDIPQTIALLGGEQAEEINWFSIAFTLSIRRG